MASFMYMTQGAARFGFSGAVRFYGSSIGKLVKEVQDRPLLR